MLNVSNNLMLVIGRQSLNQQTAVQVSDIVDMACRIWEKLIFR